MANWANPTITTQYDVFVNESKDRDVDSATMFLNAPTTPPIGSIQFSRLTSTSYSLKEWDGAAFVQKQLAVAGGGTGAADIANARANLGIGTMGTQNSNAITVTGGSVLNLTSFSLNCSIVFNSHGAYDIGSNAAKIRRAYFHEAIVLPYGVDRYATS